MLDEATLVQLQKAVLNANFPLLVKLAKLAGPVYQKIEREDPSNKNDGSDRYFKWYTGVLFKKYLPHFQSQEAAINNRLFQSYKTDKHSYAASIAEFCKNGHKEIGSTNKHIAESFKRAVFGIPPTVKADPPAFLTPAVYAECLRRSHKDFLISHCSLFEKVLGAGEAIDLKTNKRLFFALNWLSMYDSLSKHLTEAQGGEQLEWHPLNYFLLARETLDKTPEVVAINTHFKKMHEAMQAQVMNGSMDAATIQKLKADVIAANV
jgi:hypothetical protein